MNNMGRPRGTKNIMRTPEEKEKIVLEYLNNNKSFIMLANKYSTTRNVIRKWKDIYLEKGIDGFESKTGKANKHHKNMGLYLRKPKNKIEELELELMKKDIEIARLKKGYIVKGVGAKKEFVTTLDKNIK